MLDPSANGGFKGRALRNSLSGEPTEELNQVSYAQFLGASVLSDPCRPQPAPHPIGAILRRLAKPETDDPPPRRIPGGKSPYHQ